MKPVDFRKFAGQYLDMEAPNAFPSLDEFIGEVRLLREKGLGKVRVLSLPALDQAARSLDLTTDTKAEPAAIEKLLRLGVDRLGGGDFGQAASRTFGLEGGPKFLPSTERRRRAAACIGKDGILLDSFRKNQEKTILVQVAEGIYNLVQEAQREADSVRPSENESSPLDRGGKPRAARSTRPLRLPTRWALRAAVVLAMVAVGVALLIGRPSQAEQLEAAYDGKDPFSVTSDDCSGIARSQPALPVRPSLTGPDGTVVGTLELRTWPGCQVAWGRMLWNDDPSALYQIPAGWTLQVEAYRPATETRRRSLSRRA